MPEAIIKTAARIFESGRLLVIFFAAFALIIIIRNWWLISIRRKFIENIKWETLEIKIPKDNLKSPKAMEQVFSSLYGTYSGGIKRKDKWFKGKIEDWMSVELVGLAHGIHFYIRFPVNYKDLVKSAIFSQYTGAELHEVEDYTSMFGLDLPNDEYFLRR
ncbi:MAG: hypothetical protein HYR95_01585 [Candidatus Colwellbacteria bacterium]|nr:hypothetical protein [Candidatus Colwellbacteria bacterium]